MPNLNKVLLMGNLTRDPEVKYTPKGTAVGNMSIAINDSYKAQDGAIKETTTYVEIEVWGRQAETAKQFLSKGRGVFVEGKLQLDQWEKEGTKHQRLKVRAERIQFIGPSNPGSATRPPSSDENVPTGPASSNAPYPDDDSEIPF